MRNLKEIAKENGLEVINVGTSYGVKESEAIVGFKSLKEAQELADKENMVIQIFKNENGTSNCYTEYSNSVLDDFDIFQSYKEKYTVFTNEDVEHFQEVDIDERIEDGEFANESEREAWLKEMHEIKNRIANLKDDEFIYLDNDGNYSEAMSKTATDNTDEFGNHFIIGVTFE
jgi:hypothetical protein